MGSASVQCDFSKRDGLMMQEFYESGFVLVDNVFNAQEISHIGVVFDRLLQKAKQFHNTIEFEGTQFVIENDTLKRIVWACASEPELDRYALDLRLTGPSSELLESRVMEQLICQAHFKMPKDGVDFKWHQDSEHRRYGTDMWRDVNKRGSFVQTLTAIDSMDIDNSPIMIIPFSHQQGHLGLDNPERRKALVDERKLQPVLMKPGSVLFLNPYLIHGSRSNPSNRPRRVFINGYAYPGANSRKYPGMGSGRTIRV